MDISIVAKCNANNYFPMYLAMAAADHTVHMDHLVMTANDPVLWSEPHSEPVSFASHLIRQYLSNQLDDGLLINAFPFAFAFAFVFAESFVPDFRTIVIPFFICCFQVDAQGGGGVGSVKAPYTTTLLIDCC